MRSHYCGTLDVTLLDQEVELAGWVHRRRDHGGVIFIDLRDREGLAQVVCHPDAAEVFAAAETVRSEYVLRIRGRVRRRPPGTENPRMSTGAVEVVAESLEVLNSAQTPPFQLDEDDVGEDVREHGDVAPLPCRDVHTGLGHQAKQAGGFERHGFAAAGNLAGHEHLPASGICLGSYNLDLVAFL